jgi:hypothetical protein
MASTPAFGSTPRFGSVQLANADGTGTKAFDNFTPADAGTRVREIRVFSGSVAPGGTYRVFIAVFDGTNTRALESFALQNTADILQIVFRYDSLILPTGHTLLVQSRTALAASATLDFIVMGQDLT